VVFCLPSTPLDAVAKLMADNDLEEVVVLIDRKPIGYVHQNEILKLVASGQIPLTGSDFGARPPQTTVQAMSVMRKPPLLVDEKQIVSEVVDLMDKGNRRVAFVTHDDEFPVGMVTPREIAKWMDKA
jgi:CBS domain-containing protein